MASPRAAVPPVPDLAGRSVLVLRPDRLGDVILSLPVFAQLRARFPGVRLTLLASPEVTPLLATHPWIDELMLDDRRGRHRGLQGFRTLVAEVRRSSFAAAIVLRPTLRHALLVAAARIPCRVGTAFRAYSWFFTHRVRQHRRGSGRHELELNLSLLAPFGDPSGDLSGESGDWSGVRLPWVPVDPEARQAARALVGGSQPFVVLHPGSGGSACEWPPEHFARLGHAIKLHHQLGVVVTGVQAESALVAQVAAGVPGALPLAGRTTLPVLAALLAEARAVVAASTGTLHLAAAVGTPVVGIYPALPDVSPVRWGPRGPAAVALEAPSEPRGRGAGVADGVPMAAVTPEAVLAELAPWLGEESRGAGEPDQARG